MKFTDLFVRRPVLAIVVNLLIIIAGFQAIRTLNVRQYPRLESATVTVRTAYVGASADLVRGFITTPLERSIAAADGIDFIESQSTQGLSTISVRLKLNFNAAGALSDITARVNQVRADLPPEAEVPAIAIEPSDAQFAAMYLSFGSKDPRKSNPGHRLPDTRRPGRASPRSRECSAPTSSEAGRSPSGRGSSPIAWRPSASARRRCARPSRRTITWRPWGRRKASSSRST